MFSIVTVESSTRMPTASARPPKVIVLSVSPRKYKMTIELRIASGIEIMTTSVDRHEPRKTRIISAVRPAAIAPSRSTPLIDETTRTDWSNSSLMLRPDGAAARATCSACLTALTTASVEALPFLMMLRLHQRAIADGADILDEHRGAVRELHGDVVEVGDRRRHRIGANGILCVADLGRARGQREGLRIDRVHHVERRQAFGGQLQRIEIDHDLPVLAARGCRQGEPVNGRQPLPQIVDAVIIELLLVEIVRAEAELQDRDARRVVLHDDRRLDAGRQQRADRIGRRDDLRDREVEIDVGLEVDLLDRDAVERLRLDVANVADVGADRVLAVGGDPRLHLGRREPGFLPDHRDDGDVDLGKNIGRHRRDRADPEKDDQRGEHIECVRQAQREANQAHSCVGLPLDRRASGSGGG